MRRLIISLFLFSFVNNLQAQELAIDSVTLQEVFVKSYGNEKLLKNLPAAVNTISLRRMEAFSSLSILNAVNSTPGVRMEERSPGSYRINIRGSSLRSPFGVRNVKVYYNDLPITNPGGQTFLNQLGVNNFKTIEIIKGPGSSFYGAGTGGVMLVRSFYSSAQPSIELSFTAGSYGTNLAYVKLTTLSEKFLSNISYERLKSRGYRDHSEMKREVFTWDGSIKLFDGELKTTVLYGDLFYQTPGALTLAGYNANPKASRPATPAFPSAITANASIKQQSFLSGLTYETGDSKRRLKYKSSLYGMFTELVNPNIQHYDKSSEPHFGGRAEMVFRPQITNASLALTLGAEYQKGISNVRIYKNLSGIPDSLRSVDEINTRHSFVFSQAEFSTNEWLITAGLSLNFLNIGFERYETGPVLRNKKEFSNQLAPRFAVMKKYRSVNIYSSISKGFSPPSTTEFFPTGNAVNLDLDAETGINYDGGIKGFYHDLRFDINAFIFSLNNTIVQRRTAGGGDYFINAGKTRQRGLETSISYPYFITAEKRTQLWVSYALHDFTYKSFTQLNADFTGRKIPSEPMHNFSAGLIRDLKKGLSAAASYSYTGEIALNDSNTVYAKPYHLITLKLSYAKNLMKKVSIRISAGAENLLDEKYSLGNDINAFGGRYYNAAPGRSFYVSVTLKAGR
jgi:iron complex outermembrane recepter protein